MGKALRLLHTSDWHLGRTLCGRRRGAEFALFLDWLLETIANHRVDVLLIAGDVFDGPAPSPAAQELYYRFLSQAGAAGCRQVVIIAGNHDSPSFLSAPGGLLKALDIHVAGRIDESLADELICLKENGRPRLIAAAVPYPRDRDLRQSLAGENPEDKERKLVEAISGHYALIGRAAEKLRSESGEQVPIVGLGHLFAAGGQTLEGDGVRNLYVGGLGRVPAEAFPACFDYLALGHLHQPQLVGGDESRRYSGAPLAHAFAEAGRPKSLVLVDFYPDHTEISTLPVPIFQRLERLSGDWPALEAGLDALLAEGAEAWLEVDYTGQEIIGDLRSRVFDKTAAGGLEVLRIKNSGAAASLAGHEPGERLEELDEEEVFRRCLEVRGVPEEQRPELWSAYGEIVRGIREGD